MHEGQLADSWTRSLMNVATDYIYYIVAAHLSKQETPQTLQEVESVIEDKLGGYEYTFRRYVQDWIALEPEVDSFIETYAGRMDVQPALALKTLKSPHYHLVHQVLDKMVGKDTKE